MFMHLLQTEQQKPRHERLHNLETADVMRGLSREKDPSAPLKQGVRLLIFEAAQHYREGKASCPTVGMFRRFRRK